MKNYTYQNTLIGKKQLRQLLAWSFTNYDSMQACALADELKYLGFQYATKAGISISIEDLKIPFIKNVMLEKANQEIIIAEKVYFKGKITEVERFQKIIDTWSLTSESLKEQVIYYFKNYDPLNSVYIMAFSGARGNLSQVRQLVGMRGLMSDPSGEIMNLPIKKNFREGLTITDYLMSGYGARKGIVDTALKTANSGYLTRRLIDVGQDLLIREKDCLADNSFLVSINQTDEKKTLKIYEKLLGRVLSKSVYDLKSKRLVAQENLQITPKLIEKLKKSALHEVYIRSPLTCNLYRAICQKCYGWDLANENLVDIGEAIGILAGQSIGEPGTQLTMRTFHTGGIFTSEVRQQIISPINGILRFYKLLKTVLLRTNRGEDVLITKNSGSILLIPENNSTRLVQIEVFRNTILFPKNNQYILKDSLIGELININKQIKTEIKPILSDNCGEIFIAQLKKKMNVFQNNKLIWILSGQFYNSPKNSFLNFYSDYKLNQKSYIFRTKLINHYAGFVEFSARNLIFSKSFIRIRNDKYSFLDSSFQELTSSFRQKNYLLTFANFRYLLKIQVKNLKFYLQLPRTKQIAIQVSSQFKTLNGGILYYDSKNLVAFNQRKNTIFYSQNSNLKDYPNDYSKVSFRTIVWLGEEMHKVSCDQNVLMVENGDFISKGFELVPGRFSKTSGVVNIRQKNNLVQTISIKSGIVYEGKKFKNISKKLFYPGEIVLSNIAVKDLSFCEHIVGKTNEQLLVRPIELYEVPETKFESLSKNNKFNKDSNIKLDFRILYIYKPNQMIKGTKNLKLVSNVLHFHSNTCLTANSTLELFSIKNTNQIDLRVIENIQLNTYVLPNLRYKNLDSCFLVQLNQFIDCYTVLGYLEAKTLNSLEIVKIKVKKKATKQILLISNKDCFTIKKSRFPKKKLQDFIINGKDVNETGKIIIENKNFLTLQKGRPYFFPNCKNQEIINQTNLEYKVISPTRIPPRSQTKRLIALTYYDMIKISLAKKFEIEKSSQETIKLKAEFSKLFLKKNGNCYSSLIPQLLKNFSITNSLKNFKGKEIISPKQFVDINVRKKSRVLLLQSSELIQNTYKSLEASQELTFIKFMEHPLIKTNKSLGLYSITEDFFEQDVNSVFCKNSEFIESGETLGLLKLEKEITGDIVQGLPRIEEILEGRKKNFGVKRIPTSQKKSILVQKTSLDSNFEFRKLGTTVKENEKINPHKLLKVYFNYYGLLKFFFCDRKKTIQFNRLIQNYEGSYKSFKKVQSFILNSVQSVYQSQGVNINDKHLEVIIKQMTTKVLITYEGNTPLLRREVIDLYHIQYINQIVKEQGKQTACYVPLLLGITKAALNNPSFISAASFQETTRVLTKAAIEGRIDWLRGLKENIVIGHLIPAGTGSQNYRNSFQTEKNLSFTRKSNVNITKIN